MPLSGTCRCTTRSTGRAEHPCSCCTGACSISTCSSASSSRGCPPLARSSPPTSRATGGPTTSTGLRSADLASDVVGLLRHLGLEQVDVFGFSVGGAVALHLAVGHPELVRRLVVSSVSFRPDGNRPENSEAVGAMTVDMIAGTPMEEAYRAKSPHPDRLQDLLDKLGAFDDGAHGWSDAEIEGIAAPTLITVGDCDMVTLDHAVRFLRLRGGDVNGDFAGVPASQLAVFPGTTHFFGLARTALVLDVVTTFLDAPAPGA